MSPAPWVDVISIIMFALPPAILAGVAVWVGRRWRAEPPRIAVRVVEVVVGVLLIPVALLLSLWLAWMGSCATHPGP